MAEQLIASLSAPFEPDKFEDTYRNRVLELIERKAAGETELVAGAAAGLGGQGRRPHGGARSERQRRQGGPETPPDRAARRRQAG